MEGLPCPRSESDATPVPRIPRAGLRLLPICPFDIRVAGCGGPVPFCVTLPPRPGTRKWVGQLATCHTIGSRSASWCSPLALAAAALRRRRPRHRHGATRQGATACQQLAGSGGIGEQGSRWDRIWRVRIGAGDGPRRTLRPGHSDGRRVLVIANDLAVCVAAGSLAPPRSRGSEPRPRGSAAPLQQQRSATPARKAALQRLQRRSSPLSWMGS